MNKKINVGMIGFGTVGTGVIRILNELAPQIKEKVGADIVIKKIVDKDTRRVRDVKYNKNIISDDVNSILDDPTIDIVVELIGGYEPARSFILKAMNNKKHIVTANKAVLAKYWNEVLNTARINGSLVYFEASVGGGIPIIQGLNEGLAANKIKEIYGILNGTTNYILTKMTKENLKFDKALKLAQKMGFAEADPSFDIKGIDAAHKILILSAIANGARINLEDVYSEGIDKICLEDIRFAKQEFGLVVKLLGIMKKTDDGIELRVHPTLIPEEHLLASVDNEFNAIYIEGSSVGKIMFYGKGAGEMAAASAVVSDIIFLARQINNDTAGKLPYVTYNKNKKIKVCNMDHVMSKYYIRFAAVDHVGVLSKISGILGKHNISIESCLQKEISGLRGVPIVMIIHEAKEQDIKKALKEIDELNIIKSKSIYIRIEDKI